METILETLKQKSDDPDFVLADFLVHHGNELLFDLDRALDFIYCDADESYKARILVDLYKVKHLLETNRNKSGIKDNPYDKYLTSLSVKEPLVFFMIAFVGLIFVMGHNSMIQTQSRL